MTELYNPENYIISSKCPVPRIIRPGEHLYVFTGSFYIRALVEEVCFVHGFPDLVGEYRPGVWKSWYLDGTDDGIPLSKLDGTIIWNIFPWVDWPIGHAAYYGDDSFFTLEEARRCHGRFPKRKKHRRARKYLRNTMGFISKTHQMAGGPGPDWPTAESFYRKIYV